MSSARADPAGTAASRGRLHTLHPGDVACADRDDRLETLLGSCVAVVLTDPRRTVAAMCHIVYPGGATKGAPEDTAYAGAALDAMFSMLRGRGIDPHQCDAYVYGGGNMFPDRFQASHVGQRNVRRVLDELERMNVRIVGRDVGGNCYRRLAWTVGPAEPRVVAASA